MGTESILSATFGVPGSGKTYSRVRFLVDDFLINNPTGLYITNIPLNVDVISDHISSVLKCDRDLISSRLQVIPDDVLCQWEKLNQLDNKDLHSFDSSTFPPSLFFQSFDLSGAHIAIDEFHKYFGKKTPRYLRSLWNDWFAEIRKTGCVFEAITQSYGQMNEEFLDKCSTRLELVNHSDSRDPLFGVRMGDWYELRAGIFRSLPVQRVSERETMRVTSDSGRLCWKPTSNTKTFVINKDYFRFYDSFRNYTGTSSVRSSPSQIYGRKIIFWFFRRNILSILPRILLSIIFLYFTLGGGFSKCLSLMVDSFSKVGMKNSVSSVKSSAVSADAFSSVKSSAVSADVVSSVKSSAGSAGAVSSVKSSVVSVDSDPAYDCSLYKPALFYQGRVFLRNCLEISIGYVFRGGYYDGKKVVRIDFSTRSVILDDGSCLVMY